MDSLMNLIENENVEVASGEKDRHGRHTKLNKDDFKASLKSKKEISEVARKLKVSFTNQVLLVFSGKKFFWKVQKRRKILI